MAFKRSHQGLGLWIGSCAGWAQKISGGQVSGCDFLPGFAPVAHRCLESFDFRMRVVKREIAHRIEQFQVIYLHTHIYPGRFGKLTWRRVSRIRNQ